MRISIFVPCRHSFALAARVFEGHPNITVENASISSAPDGAIISAGNSFG